MRAQASGQRPPASLRLFSGPATIRIKQERYQETESLFEVAVAGRKLKLGADSPTASESVHKLAALYKEQGQYQDAEDLLLQVAKGRCLKLGDEHPHTSESLSHLKFHCPTAISVCISPACVGLWATSNYGCWTPR